MALRAGQRLGPYEILGGLGSGGMGEVYRARDPRLARTVAIKVLSSATTADPSRRRRFEHEARAVGALSHPNVLAIHDVGEHEGAPYIVTELLEGETLRERLDAGPLPARKAADTALQVARGLAAAHEHGVVHRDLKPENVFLTKAGIVKILDFGLARLEPGLEDHGTAISTLTKDTAPGTVMGTVGYMSPEQVRGEKADARADLFALGAVVYEMLAGRRAFARDTSVETLNAILRDEPPDLPPDKAAPPGLERVVRHCLEKKPEDRFQSARDLAFELEGLTDSSVATAGAAAASDRRGRWARVTLLAAGSAVAIVIGAFLAGRRSASPTIPTYRQVTFGRGFASSGRFTPDGKTFVYSASWNGGPPEIYSARTDAPESKPLGLPHGHVASVSSSGELAILLTEYPVHHEQPATLARVPLSGGTPRPVAESVTCADWAPDGEGLAVQRFVDGHPRIEFPLGRVVAQDVGCPRFSPDGSRLAFGMADGFEGIELASGKRFRITGTTEYGHAFWWAWSPTGEEIWFSASDDVEARSLNAISLAGRRRVLDRIAGAASLFDVSRDGLALVEHAFARWAVSARGPGETRERDLSVFDRTTLCDLSADGRKALLYEWGAGAGKSVDAYLASTGGEAPMRLGKGVPTALSRDGAWVLLRPDVATGQAGDLSPHLLLVPTAAGEPRDVPLQGLKVGWAGWTPDGARILVMGHEPGRGMQVFVQSVDGGGRRPLTPEGIFPPPSAGLPVSDGHHVIVPSPTGRLVLYPLDGKSEPRELPDAGPGSQAIGVADEGRSLLVAQIEVSTVRVYRVDLRAGRRTLLHEITPTDTAGVTMVDARVSADARSYAYEYRQVLHRLYLVEGLR